MPYLVDVDFRYVMRADAALADQMGNPPMTKVLQWRKMVIFEGAGPDGGYGKFPKWTDWQDVRTD